MVRYGLVCLLLVSLAWGQSENSNAASEKQLSPETPPPVIPAGHEPPSLAVVPADAPVITIAGLCDYATTHKAFDPKCKTVVTRAEYDLVMDLIHPNATRELRRWNSRSYIDTLVKSQVALERGLEKMPDFDDKVEVLRLLFYAKTLNDVLDDQEWKKVTDKEIEDYYKNNPQEFVMIDVERIFLPRFPVDEIPGETDVQKQKRQQEWDRQLKEKADSLRARAAAGGDFVALQNEAYTFTGVGQVEGPGEITLNHVRRKMFDPDQKSVMDLNPGETSPPLYDETRGYCIFKVDAKGMLPFEKAKGEIHKMFQTERVKADLDAIQRSATVTYNEAYIGPDLPEDSQASAPGATPAPSQASVATAK